MTQTLPISPAEVDEWAALLEADGGIALADAERDAFDHETWLALEMIRADQIEVSWMQDRRARQD